MNYIGASGYKGIKGLEGHIGRIMIERDEQKVLFIFSEETKKELESNVKDKKYSKYIRKNLANREDYTIKGSENLYYVIESRDIDNRQKIFHIRLLYIFYRK